MCSLQSHSHGHSACRYGIGNMWMCVFHMTCSITCVLIMTEYRGGSTRLTFSNQGLIKVLQSEEFNCIPGLSLFFSFFVPLDLLHKLDLDACYAELAPFAIHGAGGTKKEKKSESPGMQLKTLISKGQPCRPSSDQ